MDDLKINLWFLIGVLGFIFLVYIYVDVQGLIFTIEHVLLLIANYIVVEGF